MTFSCLYDPGGMEYEDSSLSGSILFLSRISTCAIYEVGPSMGPKAMDFPLRSLTVRIPFFFSVIIRPFALAPREPLVFRYPSMAARCELIALMSAGSNLNSRS